MLSDLFYLFGHSISKIEPEISTIEEQLIYSASLNIFVQFAYFLLSSSRLTLGLMNFCGYSNVTHRMSIDIWNLWPNLELMADTMAKIYSFRADSLVLSYKEKMD